MEIHSRWRYTNGVITDDGIQVYGWAVLKRGVYGVYHQISKKHLAKYINEFTFRLNEGNVKRHSLERLDSMVLAIVGKRLTFAGLTA